VADARASLKQIASRARVRTRPANLMVRGSEDYFTVRCTLTSAGYRIDGYANSSLLWVQLHCDSGVVFSTPSYNPVMNVMLLLGQVVGRHVYMNGQGLAPPAPWIYRPDSVAALEALELREEELLTVALNGVTAILRSAEADADWERLQRLVALAQILPPGAKEAPLDRRRLPEDMRDLFPLIKRWGFSDDEDRADKIKRAKIQTLRRLVERAESRLTRIAEFLSQEGGDSREGAALDGVAQSVMEARQELNRRG
jgi:hypothetical protein